MQNPSIQQENNHTNIHHGPGECAKRLNKDSKSKQILEIGKSKQIPKKNPENHDKLKQNKTNGQRAYKIKENLTTSNQNK